MYITSQRMITNRTRMSLLCCCVPRVQQRHPRLRNQSPETVVELNTFRLLPTEIWVKILKLLPLHVLWRNARPTCRSWNVIALEIVWNLLVQPTMIDVQWHTADKRIRQRLYPSIPRSPVLSEHRPFSSIARWNLPDFEKALYTSERKRYKCDNVIILLPSGKAWQNVATFALIKMTERKDIWEFEQLSSPMVDINKAFFEISWLAKWRVTFREGEERRSTSSRGDIHLDHVTVPLVQFVKLIALAEEEEWPNLGKIDGFDRRKRSRPNSGITTPRRRSEPATIF
jgi:hypothetical protein